MNRSIRQERGRIRQPVEDPGNANRRRRADDDDFIRCAQYCSREAVPVGPTVIGQVLHSRANVDYNLIPVVGEFSNDFDDITGPELYPVPRIGQTNEGINGQVPWE